ncbi:class I SAM-dependent methyltransferase [Nocardia sp. NBC_01499]|uniref:class I SAM-dependent methyltransferase n=1 Tax=Nocardia sp. NBC_01499 TaxID=2903597 RepID=UPI003869234D
MDVDDDPKELVRLGYDVLSSRYDEAYGAETKYEVWLTELCDHIPVDGVVLDLGCGSGLPVARALTAAGRRVVGVDISAVQIDRARDLVPEAEFIRSDAADLDFPADSFDAVVCFYALIHMPLDEQFAVLNKIATWLRPGGWFVGTTGHTAWTGTDDNWLGGGATMWWSQADASTYRDWLTRAGLTITRQEFVAEGDTGHALFWASAS